MASTRASLGPVSSLALSFVLGVTGCKAPSGLAWAESSAPAARVNQLGYLPQGPKRVTIESESPTPLVAELVDENGAVLWSGKTKPKGLDAASGDPVHELDFSAFTGTAASVRVRVHETESFPFAVQDDVFAKLPFDALKYFYHNRSGVAIVQPFVPSDTWSRPAGHLSDASVGCQGTQCGYRLDVKGGWYDAGDQGKYVVNGGIATWTLLALVERYAYLSKSPSPFGDGSMNIPESGNGVPDLLDEARYEIEFLLGMQVPKGQPLEGMVHHKIHDGGWTPLPFEPPSQAESRFLHPPSTAATLNLAAVAAQASRLFKTYDPAFSERCLVAARRAWNAAQKEPTRFAPETDNQGGGPYSDKILSDEFYWAAAELWLATGDDRLKAFFEASPHHQSFPTRLRHEDGSYDGDGVSGSMTWQSTAALGWISLAMAPNNVAPEETNRLRSGIIDAGDVYLSELEKEGYLLPLSLGPSKKYPWGSNSFVLNNMVVLSLAHDFSKDARYAHGVNAGMNYLLGNNPLLQSYVSGYGAIPLKNPHHRFWAHSKNAKYPPPPPGAVSGGPNSSLQDPQTKKSGLSKDLPPQKCYVDHIEAWSVNEVAINWNAPLVWTSAFLNEWRGAPSEPRALTSPSPTPAPPTPSSTPPASTDAAATEPAATP